MQTITIDNNKILHIKTWDELTSEELDELNDSHKREWRITEMTPEHHERNTFFILKDQNAILAQGQLVPINGVQFDGEVFNILGIGGIIANRKGQGYGRVIMLAIKDYLIQHRKTSVGFTGLSDFYEKCGFPVNKEAIKRFVFIDNGKRIVNTESDRVCYLDSDDKFMEKVLRNPDKEVLLPRPPDW